jgi:hypothetical protein
MDAWLSACSRGCRAVVFAHVACLLLATVFNALPLRHANGFTVHWVDNFFTCWCFMTTPAAAIVLHNADAVSAPHPCPLVLPCPLALRTSWRGCRR